MSDVRAWLRTALSESIGIAPESIDFAIRFRELGLASRSALALVAKLSERLGKHVPPTAPWEHPTPEALLRYIERLVNEDTAATPSPLASGASAHAEPIAIVGMGLRLPGGVHSPEQLWDLLRERRSGVRQVPADRWNIDAYFDPDPAATGKMSTRWGGFIDGVDQFDAEFFQISGREARQMDPQQRLTLELAWHAFEDAGVDPHTLRGASVGVFLGAMWSDYARLSNGQPESIDAFTATGQDTSIIAARVSYVFGLAGTSLTVNTACSSSAVAIHLACQSLRSGESAVALAGGISLLLAPDSTVAMTKLGAMNPSGECRAFDAGAAGYVRSEGGGLLVLKPLSRALADGDRIYCLIRGSATNNDGFSNGLTAPNPLAQQAVLRQAQRAAGVSPDSIDYVETHGPGTVVGDPIEAGSLGAVFAPGRPTERPLRIGSIKTNLGHLEAAAGVGGAMKVALALQHGHLPSNLYFERPNPHIPFDALRLRVQAQAEPWPVSSEPARAGLNSFGFGGTNCHLVFEAAPSSDVLLFALSAANPRELRERMLRALELALRVRDRRELAALCKSLALQGAHGPERFALVVRERQELVDKLTARLAAEHTAKAPACQRVVFVLPGHGGQWLGMGRSLLASEPAFRAEIEACDRCVKQRYGWSVLDELVADAAHSRLHSPEVIQLLLLSVQLGLAALLRSWGIEPDALVGHSMGEVAACQLGGVLSRADAVLILGERSRLLREHAVGRGGMLAVTLSAAHDLEAVRTLAPELEVGAYNSPCGVVLSGERSALERAEAQLTAAGIDCGRVNIPFAGHSSAMASLVEPLCEVLAGIAPRPARLAIRSTATDAALEGPECGPAYWAANLRNPVQFGRAVEALAQGDATWFVELSPHPVLSKAVAQTLGSRGMVLPSGYRNEDERAGLLGVLAQLYTAGRDPSWERVLQGPTLEQLRPELAVSQLPAVDAPLLTAVPFVLSGKSESALRAQAQRLLEHLSAHPELSLGDVAYSLAHTRSHFEHRAAVLASDRAELLEALAALARGESASGLVTGQVQPGGKLVFVFPGQGGQWLQMGQALFESSPVFRESMQACARALEPHLTWSVLAVVRGEAGAEPLDRIDVVQPVLFAMMVSLARLWQSLGLTPEAVVGHSQGEIAAAHIAGVLTLEDAARVIARRAYLFHTKVGPGAMAALELPVAEVQQRVDADPRLSIAAVNGPNTTLLSGARDAVQELVDALSAQGVFARLIRSDVAGHCAHVEPIREELRQVLQGIAPRTSALPLYSTVEASKVDGAQLDAAYWYRNGRETVRFSEAVGQLLADGHRVFVEVSSHPVLGLALQDTARVAGASVVTVGTLRRDQGELARVQRSFCELYVQGIALDLSKLVPAGRRVQLPLYAFQRQRYWLDVPRRSADVESAGLTAEQHPLLGASLSIAGEDTWRMTARLSLATHPWLAGHVVFGSVIVPGTACVELAWAAAQRVGCGAIEELTLEAPLILREQGALQLQLAVGAPETGGRRALTLYARAEDSDSWTRHASGAFAVQQPLPEADLADWPPSAASAIDLGELFAGLEQLGLSYRGAFRGLTAAYRRGADLFAEVALPSGVAADGYGLHPALFDAVLHPLVGAERTAMLPFSWSGVRLGSARSVATLRARLRAPQGAEGAVEILLADGAGQPIGCVQALRSRPSSREQLRAASPSPDALHRLEWQAVTAPLGAAVDWVQVGDWCSVLPAAAQRYADFPALVAALDAGRSLPSLVMLTFISQTTAQAGGSSELAAAARGASQRALAALQACLAEPRLAAARLLIVTRGALATRAGEGVADLVHAPTWGLMRSAQSEHPDRIQLLDVDQRGVSDSLLRSALAASEPQLAVREGRLEAPRIVRVPKRNEAASPLDLDPERAVLITGGSGALAANVARHLLERYGARHVILVSRSGQTRGVTDARVRAIACDVSDRERVRQLLAAIERPLCAVIHCAGVLEDGVVESLSPDSLTRVFAPKVDAALHLHELTLAAPLQAFVLFSSVMGLIGGPGQANYAAANSFLDALAQRRRAQGLIATSLAWGFWAEQSGMSQHLRDADRKRMAERGLSPLSTEDALSLLDRALAEPDALLIPAKLELSRLPGSVRAPAASAAASGSALLQRMAAVPKAQRELALLELVRKSVASVLGISASSIEPKRALKTLGLDSLMAVELRNRLAAATGLRLPATLLFDYPTPLRLVAYLEPLLSGDTLAPRAGSAQPSQSLQLPAAPRFRLEIREKGRLDGFALQPMAARSALGPRAVRVAVVAAGLNFRDVLNALDVVQAPAFGLECAGVVLEVGSDVGRVEVGDRVMGMATGSFADEVETDERLLVRIPSRLSFEQAATVPIVYLTALYAFEDLGRLVAGERLLVHAAAGGVGMAAVQLARARGVEVFGTASEGKWPALRALGLDDAHIASSRDLRFERQWASAGINVVLNALTAQFVDVSLRLMPRGGRFLEMGKTDLRDPERVRREYPGVDYRAFDLTEVAPDRIAELLEQIANALANEDVKPIVYESYDILMAPAAFRCMAQAKHVGKLVLRLPQAEPMPVADMSLADIRSELRSRLDTFFEGEP